MSTFTIDQAMQIAIQYHQAGRLVDAEKIYRQVLAEKSDHPDALYLLGMVALQTGQLDDGIDWLEQSIQFRPGDVEAHFNLATALAKKGRHDQAIQSYRNTLRLNPDNAAAHGNLGVSLAATRDFDQAVAAYRKAILLRPDFAPTYSNLGDVFQATGQFDRAIASYRQAIKVDPNFIDAHNHLTVALIDKGELDAAIECCCQIIERHPDNYDAHNNLGVALRRKGQLDNAITAFTAAIQLQPTASAAHKNFADTLKDKKLTDQALAAYRHAVQLDQSNPWMHIDLGNALKDNGEFEPAIAAYRQAIQLQPDLFQAYFNLGVIFGQAGESDQAIAAYNQAIALKPDFAAAHGALGAIFWKTGRLDETLACYKRAMAIEPNSSELHSALVYTLPFHPAYDAAATLAELRQWDQRYAQPLLKQPPRHNNNPSPDRRLRVGYVSPDLRAHPVGRFILPLLENHNHSDFEIFCYSDIRDLDDVTTRIHAASDTWRDTKAETDEQLARQISDDKIDLLVDLTMHMAGNRLLTFARKPAPVQLTYLALLCGTGLRAMDYRLTDPYLDPPGTNDEYYVERSIRLPKTYWCYEPCIPAPDVNALPALSHVEGPALLRGHVTFGCLNNFAKATPQTLAAWASLMRITPNSRLILHASHGSHRDRVRNFFHQQDIDPARIDFVPLLHPREYFALYHGIDIALDPFPYPGGTTTCDALWMGVPVVTLAGISGPSRCGLSILSNIGLPDLAAFTPESYIDIAAKLAGDLPRLSALRSTLRQRMRQSPLMDAPQFALDMEQAYRQMWRNWCATQASA